MLIQLNKAIITDLSNTPSSELLKKVGK